MSNKKEIKILSKSEVEQNPFYNEEKALSGNGFCYNQPLVKIKFIYDDRTYILNYDDTSCGDSSRRWNISIRVEVENCDKGVLFYLCNQIVERDFELISINEGFRDIYKILSTSEELGKYFPVGDLEDIEKRVKERLIRIYKDEDPKRINYLKEFLNDQKGRLDMTNIIFYTEYDKDINFFKKAMPSLISIVSGFDLSKTSDGDDQREDKKILLKLIKFSIARYLYNILELLNSNDPDILAYYYDYPRTLVNFEDFILEIISSDKLDRVAVGIYKDLRDGTSEFLLD